jgi:hypothetical protein
MPYAYVRQLSSFVTTPRWHAEQQRVFRFTRSAGIIARMRAQWVSRLLGGLGAAALLAGLALLLVPIHGNGVTGTAVHPRYGEFGFSTYRSLPEHFTVADLHRIGIRTPGQVVHDRRLYSTTAIAAGLLILVGLGAATSARGQ